MSDNIKVAIKVRPLINHEKDEKLPIQWVVQENKIGQIDPETGKKDEIEYNFDHIFDMNNTNQECFDATVKPIVDAVMKGFNGTIFAFGQTSSGKTYTMMGSKQELGVTRLAVEHIFNYIENDPTRFYVLRVSYFEIYNEKINDLLYKENTDMKIQEDTCGNVKVHCKEDMINSPKDVFHAMKQGDKERHVEETNMNERSSRSHTIFRITIESCIKDDPDGTTAVSQLNLVDLAGSERESQTGATGARFNEGRNINLSLSTLSLVIKQLSEGGNQHINFRDSKLTRVLQASLGGNALTTIICAVTPAALAETRCTLAFAQRAKGIKNKPQVNKTVSDQVLIKRMMKQMSKLIAEMGEIKSELKEKEKEILMGRVELIQTNMISSSANYVNEDPNHARRRQTWGGPTFDNNTLPINRSKFGLETISENEYLMISEDDAEEKKKYAKRRQSVIQQVDSRDLSFCSEIPDFEMELIKAEREKLSRESDGDFPFENTYVTKPIYLADSKNKQEYSQCNPPRTPEKKHSYNRVSSPGTPKDILRKKIRNLMLEFNNLREYTTLEKQIFQEDETAAEKNKEHDKQIESMLKSLKDSEQLCKDINKKYSELQSDYSILTEKHQASVTDCENLTMQVKSLAQFRNSFGAVEAEKKECQTKLLKASDRLAVLESESSSYEYQIEVLKEKHKKREQELEASLNSAWKELKNVKCLEKDPKKDTVVINGKENDKKLRLSSANESMSIFANNSYFDNMDVSVVPGDSSLTESVLTNQDDEKKDGNDNDNALDITILKNSTKNISVFTEIVLNNDLSRLDKKSTEDLNLIILELSNVKKNLEDDNSKLVASLQAKIRQTDDLKNDFQEFRSDMENLQKTVLLLTTENSELTARLSSEKESSNELKACHELEINRLVVEKKKLELNGANEQEKQTLIENFQNKIESLSKENIELSSSLMDQIEELDAIKTKLNAEIDKNNVLAQENLELSNNLMEKIEEYDNMIGKIELERQLNQVPKAIENLTQEQALEIPKKENNSQVNSVSNTLDTFVSDKKSADIEIDFFRASKTMTEDKLFEAQIQIEKLVQNVKDLEESFVKSEKNNQDHVAGLNNFIEKSKQTIDNLEINVNELKNSLEVYEKANEVLKNKIEQLEHEKEYNKDKNENLNETDYRMEVCDDFEPEMNQVTQNEANKSAELETARLFIKKEILSLSSPSSMSFDELDKKTVTDRFQTFINEIMKKEEVIIAHVVRGYESEKHQLEEQIKQSADAEKKMSIWAKQLESDIEHLQSHLSAEGQKSSQLIKNISELKNMLKESEHEKNLMSKDNSNQIKNIRDLINELDGEKIKSTSFNKQLADLTNSNLVIQSQLNKLSEKCEELESLNNRLNSKIGNSTDEEIVKLQTADLTNKNKILQKSLEDTINEMTELKNERSELLKINDKLQEQCQMLNQEKIQLNSSLKICKANLVKKKLNLSIDDKFDKLLQENNKIALDLEERESVSIELREEIINLKAINKNLDFEMDDIVKRMEDAENGKEEVELKFFDFKDLVEKERAVCICGKRVGETHRATTPQSLKKTNKSSPSVSLRSKHRRSDLFNQNRPKELTEELLVTEITENPICQWENLRKKIVELEQKLALKSAKVKSLQLTFNSELFPIQKKCKELEEQVLQNNKLKAELNRISALLSLKTECKICSKGTSTKRNQYTQCIPYNDRVTMVGEASGVVVEHLKIKKLESDKNELKKICISQSNQIKKLRFEKDGIEAELDCLRPRTKVQPTTPIVKTYPQQSLSSASKENVSSNILGSRRIKPRYVKKH